MSYATGVPTVDRLLDGVSTAQVSPETVFPEIRDAISKVAKVTGSEGVADEAIYAALSSAVWTFVASGEKGPHLNRWADLILRVRHYARLRKSAIAERLTTLADLMERSVNSASIDPARPKLGKHHVLILNLLQKRRGEIARAELLEETGLGESNLSHVLTKLAASRMIDRIPIGREAKIRITDEGRRILADREQLLPADSAAEDVSSAEWERSDCALAIANTRRGLIRCNAAFASLLDAKAERLLGTPVGALRESLTAKTQFADPPEIGEVAGADGRTWWRVIEIDQGDRTLWFAHDVTSYRRKIDELKKRERALSKELANLRDEAAAQEAATYGFVSQGAMVPNAPASYALADMFQGMTNDVMAPVNSIAATARLLATGKHLKRTEKDYLSAIIRNSDHLKRVLDGMIAVADADPNIQVAEPFDPTTVAREVADNFAMTAKQHGYKISVDPVEEHEVVADQYAFKAALSKTMAQVVNVVPSGTSVGIRTETDQDGVRVKFEARDLDVSYLHWWSDAMSTCQAYVRGFGGRMSLDKGILRTEYHWPFGRRKRDHT